MTQRSPLSTSRATEDPLSRDPLTTFHTVSEGEFSEVWASSNHSRNVRGWYVGTPRRAQHTGPESAARSPQPLGPPLV
jgi:hypothetical protein